MIWKRAAGSSKAFTPQRPIWLFRLISVMLGLSLFAVVELVCLAGGWGELKFGDDPLVGFESVRPLFEKTSDNKEYRTSPARRGYFKEVAFAAQKPDAEFRIFVFGGSTVQGNPFSIERASPRIFRLHWKQLTLRIHGRSLTAVAYRMPVIDYCPSCGSV
jgi:hypothetical protein